jgi:hypothetical protein
MYNNVTYYFYYESVVTYNLMMLQSFNNKKLYTNKIHQWIFHLKYVLDIFKLILILSNK